ncbi:MAG: CoA transferase [Gammaproteobacteria bacterium]|nr:CoA transferase [Gammaproteobacteria bacterium]
MAEVFTGVRVLDCSDRLSGAWAARLFGDFGAEVVLVEPEEGHALRREAPFTEDGESLMHAFANWNKRSIRQTDERLAEVIRSADVVVTTTVKLPDCLAMCADDVIHLSITPYGLTGPWAHQLGNNLTACAQVGWSAINACEEEPPLQLPHNQTGYIAGVAGFVCATAALYRRNAQGGGERCDVSEIEAMSNTCAPWAQVGIFVGNNRMAHGPNGRRFRDRPGPLWQCQNGAINFGYGDWAQWTKAFEFLGKPEIAHDPNFIPTLGRHQKDTRPVRAALSEAVAAMNKWDVFHGLAACRCISGVVQDVQELVESDHLQARGFVIETEIGGQAVKAPGAFGQLSATPWAYKRRAPKLGEHDHDLVPKPRRIVSEPPPGERTLPLKGIRVLTFTQAWSGTFGTQLLSLLGADVVQVESRKRPDVWRGAGAPVPPMLRNLGVAQNPLNTNGMYNTVNLNKRAITLDMADPDGKAMFWDLVTKFDVLCDNFSPHVMTNWGVTLESLREKRPDIIFASLSGYGRTGPLAEYPANGATTEPMAGLAAMHGYEGDIAQNTGGLIPDPITGFYFAACILAAIYHREQTGEGQRIDVSMIEAVATQCGDAMLDFAANGVVRKPTGNKHPSVAPHNVYITSDEQWFALATESDEAFEELARFANIQDDRFTNMTSRKAHEIELDAAIGAWVATQTVDELCDLFGGSAITFSPVREFESVYAAPSEQYEAREFLVPVHHPECGTHFMPLNPWIYAHTPRGPITHSPCFGQHSQEVFAEELGMSPTEYDELEARGLTGTTRI